MDKTYQKTEQSATIGYTRISDIIIDRWMPRLSGARFKIVMYIARRTYGFGKDSDRVSTSQMVHGIKKADGTVLDGGTGLDRSTVIRECKWLASEGVLHKMGVKSGGQHMTNLWALNLEVVIGEDGKGSWKSARGSRIIPPPPLDYPTHNRQLDKKQFVSPLSPPSGGAALGKKENAGSARKPAAPSSPSLHQPTPQQNRAGEGKVKERSPRRRKRSRGGTPEAGLQALTEYRNPRMGTPDLKQYVSIAKRWDFNEDNPPWWVMKELGSDSIMLKRVERVVRNAGRQAQPVELPDMEADASPPDGRVQAAEDSSRAPLHLADKDDVQTVLEAVEIEDF